MFETLPLAFTTPAVLLALVTLPALWLLLRVTGAETGPTGGRRLTATSYIQRVNTDGGIAPAGDCPAVGAKLFVPYTADYVLYRARR